ncbi:MAG TPA: MBL fold metallo-hydrolase [Burkholderiaceae bacterium]
MPDPAASSVNAAPAPDRRVPRAAATLVVVRDGGEHGGIEVLLARRKASDDQNSGAWVFPGGVVDAGDHAAQACCRGLDDAAASARLGLTTQGLDHYVSAVRECFEEVGLLFASRAGDASGELVRFDDDGGASSTQSLLAERGALHRGERALADLCRDHGLQLAVDSLVYLSHWLTPLGRPKRFDTRFFIAAAPAGQQASVDGVEMLELRWFRAADALAQGVELKLMTPTQKTLELVARFDRVAALLAWAAAPRDIARVLPRIGRGSQGVRPVLPDEYAWAEIGRLDPEGRGDACYDIQPGVAVRLSPRLIRVTANNGSIMTGPGTNTYLVGGGERNEWAAIDPGPLDERHVEAILAAAPGAIRWIFATHTHTDHSPAVAPLKARTGATVYGQRSRHAQWQDATFAPDVELSGGERFELPGPDGGKTTLRVIHTPGHASNHLCYLLEEERLLFTGDHVMQASTVVINPPDGDMAAYVASLRALIADEGDRLEWLAPGHGFLMAQPTRAMQWIIEHRLKREAKVLAALQAAPGGATPEALLGAVYDDVPARLHAMALRSLTAHLLKLEHDGKARRRGDAWLAS